MFAGSVGAILKHGVCAKETTDQQNHLFTLDFPYDSTRPSRTRAHKQGFLSRKVATDNGGNGRGTTGWMHTAQ